MPELSGPRPEKRARLRTVRLGELAERQGGVVHRDQMRAVGFSDSAISRWLAERRIVALYPAVYAVAHRALPADGPLRAALMHAGPGAALSHLTAAWWWGLVDEQPRTIHVSAPGDVGSPPGLVVHHPRELEVAWHKGLPVTVVARVLLDAAASVAFGRLRKMLAEAEFQRLVSVHEVEAVLRRGRPGSAALRRAVQLHHPQLARTRSVLEERFLALCERHEISRPLVNVHVAGFLVDAYWPTARLIVELDGHAAHATPAGVERDRARDLALRAAGHRVLRYTWAQVTRTPAMVAADLTRELSAREPAVRAQIRTVRG